MALTLTVGVAFLFWGVLGARLERWNLTAPIVFLVLGLLVANGPWALIHLNLHSALLRSLAEVTLAMLLFTDASRVRLHALKGDAGTALRLLGVGLPLSIVVGTAIAYGLFAHHGLWLAALLAAIVAPTDAALGSAIVEDERVPTSIRRLLSVESGLNDGIATPFVNLFLAGALSVETVLHETIAEACRELVVGAGVGVAVGLVGGVVLRWSLARRLGDRTAFPVAVLGLAIGAFALAHLLAANGFVAAFIAGLAFGAGAGPSLSEVTSFTDATGGALSLVVWLSFGASMLVPGVRAATPGAVLFACLALTVMRMVPVAISLLGSGYQRQTVAFIGWFGPRGLASVVFVLLARDALEPGPGSWLVSVVTVTVTLSIVAHGLSAQPWALRFGAMAKRLGPDAPERHEVHAPPSHRPIARWIDQPRSQRPAVDDD